MGTGRGSLFPWKMPHGWAGGQEEQQQHLPSLTTALDISFGQLEEDKACLLGQKQEAELEKACIRDDLARLLQEKLELDSERRGLGHSLQAVEQSQEALELELLALQEEKGRLQEQLEQVAGSCGDPKPRGLLFRAEPCSPPALWVALQAGHWFPVKPLTKSARSSKRSLQDPSWESLAQGSSNLPTRNLDTMDVKLIWNTVIEITSNILNQDAATCKLKYIGNCLN